MSEKLIKFMTDWYQSNRDKNKAQSGERKNLEQAQKEYGTRNAPFVHDISNTLALQAGLVTSESEEIDPKAFMERHPDKFWDLVTIPKTNATAMVGDKEVALCSRTVKNTVFKIVKVKKDVI